jgi:hypothetical protein
MISDTMSLPMLVEPHELLHFAIDPQVGPNFMARVTPNGIGVYPNCYFLTGEGIVIPPNGRVVVFLCHVPDSHHEVEPGGCSLLKNVHDPHTLSTGLVLTNPNPHLGLVVPPNCDIYSLVQNVQVQMVVADDTDIFSCYENK